MRSVPNSMRRLRSEAIVGGTCVPPDRSPEVESYWRRCSARSRASPPVLNHFDSTTACRARAQLRAEQLGAEAAIDERLHVREEGNAEQRHQRGELGWDSVRVHGEIEAVRVIA